MEKSDIPRIAQMHANIEKIELFTEGHDRGAFMKDEKTQSAILMQLLLLGEIAKRVSEETKSQISINWPAVQAFRNVIVHEYYEVELSTVWTILQEDLPSTKEALEHFLRHARVDFI